MGKIQKKPNTRKVAFSYRKNDEIVASELRVIGEIGENLGVMSRKDALELARSKETDLIEIVPTVSPPIVRLGNYDKFRYQKEKELKKREQPQSKELKQIQVTPKSARNDLLMRARRIDEFLSEGHKVEILMKLRGREKGNKEWAEIKLREFLELITESFKIINDIKYSGSGFSVQIDKTDKKNG